MTDVLEVFETVAVKASVVPRRSVPVDGVIVTVMEEGGGAGGATGLAPSPPQPRVHAPNVRRTNTGNKRLYGRKSLCAVFGSRVGGRGRMRRVYAEGVPEEEED
jgi:hypothetical protein